MIFLYFISLTLHARTDCSYVRVKHIQVQEVNAIALFTDNDGSSWWKVILLHDSANAASFQSVIQQAVATNEPVMIRYESDNYNCNKDDYTIFPTAIRL